MIYGWDYSDSRSPRGRAIRSQSELNQLFLRSGIEYSHKDKFGGYWYRDCELGTWVVYPKPFRKISEINKEE